MICRAERAKHFKNRKCTILLQRSLYALELKIWNITILFIKCCKSSLHTSCFLPPLSPTLTHTPATRADRLQSMRTRGLTRAWGEERLQGGGVTGSPKPWEPRKNHVHMGGRGGPLVRMSKNEFWPPLASVLGFRMGLLAAQLFPGRARAKVSDHLRSL